MALTSDDSWSRNCDAVLNGNDRSAMTEALLPREKESASDSPIENLQAKTKSNNPLKLFKAAKHQDKDHKQSPKFFVQDEVMPKNIDELNSSANNAMFLAAPAVPAKAAEQIGGSAPNSPPISLLVPPMRPPIKRLTLSNEHSKRPTDMSYESLYNLTFERLEDSYPIVIKNRQAWDSFISLLSGLYALILVILAFAFELSIILSDHVTSYRRYEAFYIYLYTCGILFLVYSYVFLLRSDGSCSSIPLHFFRKREVKNGPTTTTTTTTTANQLQLTPTSSEVKTKVTHSAPTAGSLYLRLGCVVFGAVGMIHSGLRIYFIWAADSDTKFSPVTILEPGLAAAFVFVQMYFIFQNSKLIIHRYKNIGRVGTMHLVATNLCVWIRLLVHEEFTVMTEIQENTEHSESDNHSGTTTTLRGNLEKDDTCDYSDYDCVLKDLNPFMITCIIEYSIICGAIMFVLWRNIGHTPGAPGRIRRKHNFKVDCSSSTRGLFVGLLFVVCTIVSMIIFFVKLKMGENFEALWVLYISDSVLYVFSVTACFLGMYKMRILHYVAEHRYIMLQLDEILLFVALIGQLIFCIFSIVALTKISIMTTMLVVVSVLRMVQVLIQTVFILGGQRLMALNAEVQERKPGRNIVTFLLMVNLALFLINTFETQKASANPVMLEFYGKSAWTLIVHTTVPLTIFYRFHSSVCLAEIWKQAYKVKSEN